MKMKVRSERSSLHAPSNTIGIRKVVRTTSSRLMPSTPKK